MAIAAVDIALWDLKARQLERPLVSLLGPARSAVPVYGSGGFTSYDEARLREQLGRWVGDGIAAVKMKVGRHPARDLQRVAVARDAVGDAELFVDANGAYGRKQALALAGDFARLGVGWFEEPVPSADVAGLRLLRDRMPGTIDVAAGEYGYTLAGFRRLLEAGAVDVLQADATRCQGITGFLQGRGPGRGLRLPLSTHCAPVCTFTHPAPPARPGTWSTSTITSGSSIGCSTARLVPGRGCSFPTRPGPASDSQSSVGTRRVSRPHAKGHRMTVTERGQVPKPPFAADLARALRDGRRRGSVRFRQPGSPSDRCVDYVSLRSASSFHERSMPCGGRWPCVVDNADHLRRGNQPGRAGLQLAVVIDYSKYLNEVLEIDEAQRLARVEPGCVLDNLRQVARSAGLTYGPDPATHDRNTLGGMIGNNSCGVHSVMAQFYGPGPLTRHQVAKLTVLTYDGAEFDVGPTPEAESS